MVFPDRMQLPQMDTQVEYKVEMFRAVSFEDSTHETFARILQSRSRRTPSLVSNMLAFYNPFTMISRILN